MLGSAVLSDLRSGLLTTSSLASTGVAGMITHSALPWRPTTPSIPATLGPSLSYAATRHRPFLIVIVSRAPLTPVLNATLRPASSATPTTSSLPTTRLTPLTGSGTNFACLRFMTRAGTHHRLAARSAAERLPGNLVARWLVSNSSPSLSPLGCAPRPLVLFGTAGAPTNAISARPMEDHAASLGAKGTLSTP